MTLFPLARFLHDRRDVLVARFVAGVQTRDLPPSGVARPLLVDHIPDFLDEVIAELSHVEDARPSLDAVNMRRLAGQHGGQRWTLGYDLQGLVREYGVLHHAVLELAKEAGVAFSLDELDVLARCLNVGVAAAAAEYAKDRQRQLDLEKANLEFLAQAGNALSSSLDYRSTLSRLTGIIVPRLADWCAVHLEGGDPEQMPLAHADPSKLEILRTLYKRYPPSSDSPHGHLRVIRTGEPQLMSQVDAVLLASVAESPEHLDMLRAINACSWIIVPLRVQGNVFGALTLALCDQRGSYGPSEMVFAGELAGRAAVALDNARLYDLSQKERSRAESVTRAKDEFVAMVSHELRTPLNAMLGWVRLMRSGALPESKRDRALDVIERNARAQNQLVTDLLDISRAITGKMRVTPTVIDLGNVVEMAVEGVRPAAEAKRVVIEVKIRPESAIIRGDGDRLQQVVWNLLANAVKFTPKGGWVRVQLQQVDSDVEMVVEDSGEGIALDFLPHVFDSFRQSETGASRTHGGLGIGLSIAKHIVELHGGSIVARSKGPGCGATFVVRLPISPLVSATPGMSRVPATTEPAVDTDLPLSLQGIRVLVVDDEPDARELVAYVLETCGMSVRVASSSAEAVSALETFTPHVIVSDVGMPDEDGYRLIRAVRTLPKPAQKDIPAIALTAFARNEDRTRALVAGFNLHMAKPVEPSSLVSAVVSLAGQVIPMDDRTYRT